MDPATACLIVVDKIQDSGPEYHYPSTQLWRHLELSYKEEPRHDSDITNMLETLQDSSVRVAWHNKINALDAFISLAKGGWAGIEGSSCCLCMRLTYPFMMCKIFVFDDLNNR